MGFYLDPEILRINLLGRSFFESALDFHGGDDRRGGDPPKLIAAPQKVLLGMNYFIYRIDKYLYSSRQTRPLKLEEYIFRVLVFFRTKNITGSFLCSQISEIEYSIPPICEAPTTG